MDIIFLVDGLSKVNVFKSYIIILKDIKLITLCCTLYRSFEKKIYTKNL